MIELSTDQACFVILKARQFDAKDVLTDPDDASNASDDDMAAVLEDHADDPVVEELTEFIRSLNEDQQCELVALTWLGRGDYTEADFEELLEEARGRHNDRTAEYLLGMPMVGDYLERGLELMGGSCSEFEARFFS